MLNLEEMHKIIGQKSPIWRNPQVVFDHILLYGRQFPVIKTRAIQKVDPNIDFEM